MVFLFGRGRFSVPACTHGERRAERQSRMAAGYHRRRAVLIGGTGTGKSHLAVAIARACIRAPGVASNDAVDRVRRAKRRETTSAVQPLSFGLQIVDTPRRRR
jgi:putative ribosome biogenesis GTPase RsgA